MEPGDDRFNQREDEIKSRQGFRQGCLPGPPFPLPTRRLTNVVG